MRRFLLISLAALVLAVPQVGFAAAYSLLWGSTLIEEGGTYPVSLGELQVGTISAPDSSSLVYGSLYLVSDTRALVTSVSAGGTNFSFEEAGSYEIDVYEAPVFEETRAPITHQFFAWLFATPAYAQFGGRLVATLHFTITDANVPQYEECCSSVVFLPGFKGSVLKIDSDTLWPPTVWSDDIPQLALTEAGESVNDVIVDDVLENFYGTPIYSGFTSFLDDLVENDTIANWEPFPYDWRFSPLTIVENGVARENGTFDLVAEIERLAQDSQTGKVTIVAHSYGGLVGKALIKELEAQDKANLIDSYVMVGSPQLGTPQAIASILHGDAEEIAKGVIVDAADARSIAQEMPSAYHLLPSPRYFTQVTDPVIHFNENAQYATELISAYGDSISNHFDFESYVTADEVARPVPIFDSLNTPEILDRVFFNTAEEFHQEYDSYVFPSDIRVVQVAGWGVPTVKGIEYRKDHGLPSYVPTTTIEGDKTVVYPSAIASGADETYFFNLSDYNKFSRTDTQHRNLLNVAPVKEFIRNIVQGMETLVSSYISQEKPTPNTIADQLLVSTHSPVVLGAYDSAGNYSGITPGQDLSSEFLTIQEDIPGSSFLVFGESQYLFLPLGGTYRFVISGTGEGLMTVEIQNFSNDSAADLATYTDIPVLTTMQASFKIEGSNVAGVAISVDANGDGNEDAAYLSDEEEAQQAQEEEPQVSPAAPASNGPPVAVTITLPGLVQGTSTISSISSTFTESSLPTATTTVSTTPSVTYSEPYLVIPNQEASVPNIDDSEEENALPVQTTESAETKWYDEFVAYLKSVFIQALEHLKL